MPNYTVSQDIDDFMKSDNDAAARTELGLGSAATSSTGDFAGAVHNHPTTEITGLDTAISSNANVSANTAARHDEVTVTDSTEINLQLVNQALTADLNSASIAETKLDLSTQTKLGKADTALQSGDNISTLTNDAGYLTTAPSAPVDSVNTQTGAVVLDADDIGDAATTNKFATQAELDKANSALQSADIDTLSELNAILTDANLDDATSTRTPSAHTHTLSDLTQSSATDGEIIAWNNAASEWQPIANTGGSASPATAETSVWIDGAAMFAESSGATAETIYGANNASDVFQVATGEAIFSKIAMPPQWDGSDLEAEFVWGSSTGTATQNVRWGISAQAIGNDDAWDSAFSATTQTLDDPIINNTDLHVVSVAGITPSGTPQDGDLLFIKLVRETAGATVSSDDVQLYGIRIKYQNKIIQNWYVSKLGNEADDTSGTGEKTAWIAPASGKINAVHSGSSTATIAASLTADVQVNGTTILSTKGVIAAADDSTASGTAHVLTSDPTSFIAGDRISFHVDTFGGTGAKGLHTDLLISWD